MVSTAIFCLWFTSLLTLNSQLGVGAIEKSCSQFIRLCISDFEKAQSAIQIRVTTEGSPYSPNRINEVIPSVILWNPLVNVNNYCQLTCSLCKSALRHWKWKDGSNNKDVPRNLFCIQERVLLVSSVFLCERNHQIVSHDPSILNEMKKRGHEIPFVLFHKSGVTKDLFHYISITIQTGINIEDVEHMLINLHSSRNLNKLRNNVLNRNIDSKSSTNKPLPYTIGKDFIGRKLISKVFIRAFLESEHMYTQYMAQKYGRWISFDHTFKVAANIGYWEHGIWRKLYDCLFIVMNENSDILAWQLTKGTALNNVDQLLEVLNNRLATFQEDRSRLSGIIVDNCCTLKNKLKDIFGPNVLIKLDLFHGIQRIVKKIPKQSGTAVVKRLRKQLIKDLRLCFRKSSDLGDERKENTPSPTVTESNIQQFILKWKDEEIENSKILPVPAHNEIEKLLVHIKFGCLSDIPPGIGTNRNERLHRKIRKWLRRTRMGVCLAVAILTTIFYIHMEQNNCDKERSSKILIPITQWYANFLAKGGLHSNEKFGIGANTNLQLANFENVSDDGSSLADNLPEHDRDDECFHLDSDEEETFAAETSEMLKTKAAVMADISTRIFSKAKAPITADKNLWIFSNSVLLLFSNPNIEVQNDEIREESVDGILKGYGFTRRKVEGNGDCCFLAAAVGIDSFLEDESQEKISSHLNSLGLYRGQTIYDRVTLLRSLVVGEFPGENSKDYLMFLVSSDQDCYEEMANCFLEQGFFDCELGNGVLLALSNVMKCSIICFTSIDNYPVVPIIPRHETLSSVPLYVAFTHFGKGHYDAICSLPEHGTGDCDDVEVKNIYKCSCGRGGAKNKSKAFCNTYGSRCKCFQSMNGCSDLCECINCGNPYGNHNNSPQVKPTRKRKRHHDTPESSVDFLQRKGEPQAATRWTDFDNFLLQQVANMVVGVDESSKPDYERIHNLFKEVSITTDSSWPSIKEIKLKVDTFLRDQTAFRVMLKQQLHLNWS